MPIKAWSRQFGPAPPQPTRTDPIDGHWVWRDAPGHGGDAVLVDIDGVIADASHRQHFLDGAKDWDSFFGASSDDPPLIAGMSLVDLLDERLTIVLVTSRPAAIADSTVAWLAKHEVRWDLLIMRASDDRRPAAHVKSNAVRRLRQIGYEPLLGFDDDPNVVKIYGRLDIAGVHIHSGYY